MEPKILKVKNGDVTKTINEFLKELLNSGKVHSLLVPQAVPSKKMVFPVLISDPNQLNADVFAPLLPASTARIISKMTKFQATKEPIGVVLRSCQIRALVELVKLNQANLENIIIIGVDCLGTFSIDSFVNFSEGKTPTEFILEAFKEKGNSSDKYLRSACCVCKDPIPTNADITIGVYGVDLDKEVLIDVATKAGEKVIEDLKLDDTKSVKEREKSIKTIREEKTKKRTEFVNEKKSINGIAALSEFFDKCINCHNCMTVCPICYCKECLYDSSVFDAEAYKFLRKADRKGLFKMPNDSLLFHLGKMNHMILSCVECGLCEQGCPSNIPLMDVFIPAAENAQKEFDYHPGKDPEEKIPMIVYREDEYLEVGEK